MKITVGQLRRVIKEEVSRMLREAEAPADPEGFIRSYLQGLTAYRKTFAGVEDNIATIKDVEANKPEGMKDTRNQEIIAAWDALRPGAAEKMWNEVYADFRDRVTQAPGGAPLERPGVDRDLKSSGRDGRNSGFAHMGLDVPGPGGRRR